MASLHIYQVCSVRNDRVRIGIQDCPGTLKDVKQLHKYSVIHLREPNLQQIIQSMPRRRAITPRSSNKSCTRTKCQVLLSAYTCTHTLHDSKHPLPQNYKSIQNMCGKSKDLQVSALALPMVLTAPLRGENSSFYYHVQCSCIHGQCRRHSVIKAKAVMLERITAAIKYPFVDSSRLLTLEEGHFQ